MKKGKKHVKMAFERLKTWIKNVLICLCFQLSLCLYEGFVQVNKTNFSSGNYPGNVYLVLSVQLYANTSQQ